MREHVPPHAMDAELAVLGGIMLDPEALERLEGSLLPEHFYVERHRLIFGAMMDLAAKGQPVDGLTIKDYLEQRSLLDNCGGESYLGELISAIPTSANVKHYASIVRDRAVLRELLSVCSKVSQKVYQSPEIEVGDHLDQAEMDMLAVAERFSRSRPTFSKMSDLMIDGYHALEKRYAEKRAVTGTPTGFTDLDEITSGLQPSDLLIIAGRPAMGKTAFAMNLARNAAMQSDFPGSVAVFSLEMSVQQIAMRMLACEARVNMKLLRTGRFSADDWRKLAAASGSLAESPIFIDDTPAISVTDLRSKCRRLKKETGKLNLIIIDYLQLMSGRADAERREQEISEITRSLKGLAKELDVPVIALSQLNRSLESRADKRPMMSDLRESGAIEQDADIIMFVYRDEVYNKKPENEGHAELIIAKQRNGPTGTVNLTFLHEFTRFENFAHRQGFDE
ncbi:MAG: replicative DNA helicase [Zetaproteobacteria bacterium CG06_land_8_20_14_3_00_59_53]|nr:MAG: replicative DNA helicase [Zetaproteobacteria bacterium CG2_30_59_37]PIO90627.1 MAG: replicative DNA helicase [Zetaproteobacteria bacterium CG23_combo_of_CG06-09_8_20_14_all_59_86]PIQ66109.1 MAG: replicative DNA helicase [Zetaproteobacteria bacterium CG11_big_fil_rev_8_21_14_0_20_59_439]PIU71574.1 MAG: replicative DNA helicase [Zetaproteobacteria bacterium CG06_land_8_20_14_3_00_59_53]PIU97835.1 MAG: replicative DNA helicase [Zetaproteobacteria bacterium CG03_land_8_20_14_0_80_59_51]PIY